MKLIIERYNGDEIGRVLIAKNLIENSYSMTLSQGMNCDIDKYGNADIYTIKIPYIEEYDKNEILANCYTVKNIEDKNIAVIKIINSKNKLIGAIEIDTEKEEEIHAVLGTSLADVELNGCMRIQLNK